MQYHNSYSANQPFTKEGESHASKLAQDSYTTIIVLLDNDNNNMFSLFNYREIALSSSAFTIAQMFPSLSL